MSTYTAEIAWLRGNQDFLDNRYSRRHVLRFDGGIELPGSSSPHVVPLPFSAVDAVDPEELFVASLSSCHMLWFLSLAAAKGHVVDSYVDRAEGRMAQGADGKWFMSEVCLRPGVRFADPAPSPGDIVSLHHEAHRECFIANSVKTDVRCHPVFEPE